MCSYLAYVDKCVEIMARRVNIFGRCLGVVDILVKTAWDLRRSVSLATVFVWLSNDISKPLNTARLLYVFVIANSL